jgi:hypothetical protein
MRPVYVALTPMSPRTFHCAISGNEQLSEKKNQHFPALLGGRIAQLTREL